MSDTYCKGCRDEPGGCERCNPAREERAARERLAYAERQVLVALELVAHQSLINLRDHHCNPAVRGVARAELALRKLRQGGREG